MRQPTCFAAMCLVVLVATSALLPTAHAYGEPVNGVPTYWERTGSALLNAARVGPSAYNSAYMSGYSSVLGSQASKPLLIDPSLSLAAHDHSVDLATNCHVLQYDSCAGVPWSTLIEDAYNCPNGAIVANMLGMGTYGDSPLNTINSALCSATSYTSAGSPVCCAASNTKCDSMRTSMLSTSYACIGIGEASDSTNGYDYWSVFMGSCNPSNIVSLIASGSHIVMSGETRFFATYYDASGGSPNSATVYIGGKAETLQLDTGSGSMGNYYYQDTSASECREYYFQFVAQNGATYRYPDTGYFNTYGEGSCTTDWTSSSHTGDPTVPGVPQNIAVSSITTSGATITWSPPLSDGGSAITSYEFVFKEQEGSSTFSTSGNDNQLAISGLQPGTSYDFTMTAVNAVGSGAASNQVSFITATTLVSPSPAPPPAASPSPSNGLPTSFNFHTTTNCFAGILNQQSCGGCYGFSTASANSDRACWAESIPAPILSPQQIFDCGYPNVWSGSNACDGGYLFEAGQFVATSGLLTAATDALTSGCSPFECASGSCPSATCPGDTCSDGATATAYKASSASPVTGVENMMNEIYNNGPITAGFDVCQSFYDFYNVASNAALVYKGSCTSSSSDYVGGHAISIVGWGTDSTGTDYWLIQNSWSSSWGDNGFFRMPRGINSCGIEDQVTATAWPGQKRYGAVSTTTQRSTKLRLGARVSINPSSTLALTYAQFLLDQWSYSNNKHLFKNKQIALPNSNSGGKRQASTAFVSGGTSLGYTVSDVRTVTAQVVAGSSVYVELTGSNGASTVSLAGTALSGPSMTTGTTAVTSGSSGLSTIAIIGIVVGCVVGALALTALAAVVGGVIYRRKKDNTFVYGDQVYEMEAPGDNVPKSKSNSWFAKRPKFQSITARSPPIQDTKELLHKDDRVV